MSALTENFTYSTGALRTVGTNWSRHSLSGRELLVNADGRVYQEETTGFSLHWRSDVTPISPDYTTGMTIRYVGSERTGMDLGVTARMDTVGNNRYTFSIRNISTGNWRWVIAKTVSGVTTTLGTAVITPVVNQDYELELVVTGTSLEGFVDGVSTVTATDSSITDAGKPGIYATIGSTTTGAGLLGDVWIFADAPPQILSCKCTGSRIIANVGANVSIGAGGSGGLTVTGLRSGTQTATYVSGAGSPNLIFSVPNQFKYREPVTFSYTQPTDGFSTSDGPLIDVTDRTASNTTQLVRFRTVRNNLVIECYSNESIANAAGVSGLLWSFGDSTTATTSNPQKTYSTAGTYTVSLAITDNDGGITTETQIITVVADQTIVTNISPGVTAPASWADTSQPSAVGFGDESVAKPIAAWDIPVEYWWYTWTGEVTIWVGADHAREIDRVEVVCNNGTAAVCVMPVDVPGGLGRKSYPFKIDAADFGSSEYCEFRAVIYPKIGTPRVLQDSFSRPEPHDSSWYTNANFTPVVKYCDVSQGSNGDGTSGSPYNTLGQAILAKNSDKNTPWLLRLTEAVTPITADTEITGGLKWQAAMRMVGDTGDVTVEFDGRACVDTAGFIRYNTAVITFGPSVAFDTLPSTDVRDYVNASSQVPRLYDGTWIFDQTEITSTLGMGMVGYAFGPLAIGATSIVVYKAANLPTVGTDYQIGNEDAFISETISWTGKTDNGDGSWTLTGVTALTNAYPVSAIIGDVSVGRRNTIILQNGLIIADRTHVHSLGSSVPKELRYQRQLLIQTIGSGAVLYNGCALDVICNDLYHDQDLHSDIFQPYYNNITNENPVDNYYVDGMLSELYIYGNSAQIGNITDDGGGYENMLLKRVSYEGEDATQLTLACDKGQAFKHLLMIGCTLHGILVRIASFSTGTTWENTRLIRNYFKSIIVENDIKNDSYNIRIENCYSKNDYSLESNNVTDDWAISITEESSETGVFVQEANSPYGTRNLSVGAASPLVNTGLTWDREWVMNDVVGNAITSEIGAFASILVWTDIAGATNNSLVISNVQASDYGKMRRCIVTNSEGQVTSNQVTVVEP